MFHLYHVILNLVLIIPIHARQVVLLDLMVILHNGDVMLALKHVQLVHLFLFVVHVKIKLNLLMIIVILIVQEMYQIVTKPLSTTAQIMILVLMHVLMEHI